MRRPSLPAAAVVPRRSPARLTAAGPLRPASIGRRSSHVANYVLLRIITYDYVSLRIIISNNYMQYVPIMNTMGIQYNYP